MAPGYSRYSSPVYSSSPTWITGTSTTGAAQALANMNRELIKTNESMIIDRMQKDLRNMRHELDYYRAPRYIEPKPSVEVIDHTPTWWTRLKADPIWEIFKRPKLS